MPYGAFISFNFNFNFEFLPSFNLKLSTFCYGALSLPRCSLCTSNTPIAKGRPRLPTRWQACGTSTEHGAMTRQRRVRHSVFNGQSSTWPLRRCLVRITSSFVGNLANVSVTRRYISVILATGMWSSRRRLPTPRFSREEQPLFAYFSFDGTLRTQWVFSLAQSLRNCDRCCLTTKQSSI